MTSIILGLGTYFSPVNALSKKICAMRHGIRNPRSLKVRRYAACLIDLNEYLDVLHGAKISNCFGVTELNEILLNSMTNRWTNQEYFQGIIL